MSWKHGYGEWEFPKLKDSHQIPNLPSVSGRHSMNNSSTEKNEFWSVKFYPYTKPDVDPIYAVVGGKHILICRPPTENKSIEIVRFIYDEEPSADHYACCWTKDLATRNPLLCVAGIDAKIKIFDVLSGKLLRVLDGHGGEIHDLVISPTNSQILASCSSDQTIRMWSLDAAHKECPCAAILSGGHRDTVSTLDFHHTGRYLLSGGIDHIICLWTLPDFPDHNTGTNVATQIRYPHFASSEIHTDAVDCLCFYEDSILSRSANESCIVLWEITGFDSEGSAPSHDKAPTQHEAAYESATLTCFTDPTKFESYIRVIEFSAPETEVHWMRFSLFRGLPIPDSTSYLSLIPNPSSNPPNLPHAQPDPSNTSDLSNHTPSLSSCRTHPILAISSHTSKIYFWDLTRLTSYFDYINTLPSSLTSKTSLDPSPTPQIPPSYSTIFGLPSSQQTPAPEDQGQAQKQHKRPPFLTPYRPRGPRGGRGMGGKIASRLRDVSPASSATTTTSTSHSSSTLAISHGVAAGLANGINEKTPTTRNDIKIWNEKYNLRQRLPLERLKPHKEEVIKGWRFLGRSISWSKGGEWCVVAGGEGVVGVLGR